MAISAFQKRNGSKFITVVCVYVQRRFPIPNANGAFCPGVGTSDWSYLSFFPQVTPFRCQRGLLHLELMKLIHCVHNSLPVPLQCCKIAQIHHL